MLHDDNSITVNRPIAEVFEFIADGLNNPKWRPPVLDIKLKSGETGKLNAEYAQTLKGPLGLKMPGSYKLVEVNYPNKIKFAVTSGPARPIGEFLFTEAGNATNVVFKLDYEPKGIKKLMSPMIKQAMRGEVSSLSNLKQVLEG